MSTKHTNDREGTPCVSCLWCVWWTLHFTDVPFRRALQRGYDTPPLATKESDGVTVHRMRPPCADFPVYDNATYLLGYTWHVLGALCKLMETVKFDVLDFPE